MDKTELLYLNDMYLLEVNAKVVAVVLGGGIPGYLVLDRTVFYPQGGGQPYDTGVIESDKGKFIVSEVRSIDGEVRHIGSFESGVFGVGDEVSLKVDKERRDLNTRVHSAGHILDMALANLGFSLKPGKGFHAPEGPYVEYYGDINDINLIDLKTNLDIELSRLVNEGGQVSVEFIPDRELNRLVKYKNFGIFCGGTHVRDIKDIRSVYIRKMRVDKDVLRIAYAVKD